MLCTTLRIILASRFPHILWWAREYIQFCNDAYRPIPGAKHPDLALGQPASRCWAEIWNVIGPLIDRPFSGGPATWDDDIELEVDRYGFTEETHFTIAYSPVPDDAAQGGIGGVLATVHEITEKVIAERRVAPLRDLGARAGDAKTAEEACRIAASTLAPYVKDIPFALLYLLDGDGKFAHLAGAANVEAVHGLCPLHVDVQANDAAGWPVAEALSSERVVLVDMRSRFPHVVRGPCANPPQSAVTLAIPSNRAHAPVGFLIAGISPRLRLDEQYLAFVEFVCAPLTLLQAPLEERPARCSSTGTCGKRSS